MKNLKISIGLVALFGVLSIWSCRKETNPRQMTPEIEQHKVQEEIVYRYQVDGKIVGEKEKENVS
jgi:hypothetical protein